MKSPSALKSNLKLIKSNYKTIGESSTSVRGQIPDEIPFIRQERMHSPINFVDVNDDNF